MKTPEIIVYTSNTGYTQQYAELLAQNTGAPVYNVKEAPEGKTAIYLGWLYAGRIVDYKKAAKKLNIVAVCSVGMGKTGEGADAVRSANAISEDIPVYTLQGGFDMNRLKGMEKLLMKMMKKILLGKLKKKEALNEDDLVIKKLLTEGGSCVCVENLAAVLELWK